VDLGELETAPQAVEVGVEDRARLVAHLEAGVVALAQLRPQEAAAEAVEAPAVLLVAPEAREVRADPQALGVVAAPPEGHQLVEGVEEVGAAALVAAVGLILGDQEAELLALARLQVGRSLCLSTTTAIASKVSHTPCDFVEYREKI